MGKTINTLIQEKMWKIWFRTNYEAMRMKVLFKFNMECFYFITFFCKQTPLLLCAFNMQNARNENPFKNNKQPNKHFRADFFLMLLYLLCLWHLLFYYACVETKTLTNSFRNTWFAFCLAKLLNTMKKLAVSLFNIL